MVFEQIIERTLALDLEAHRSSGQIRRIGALFKGETFEWRASRTGQPDLERLEALALNAEYVLGHNILNHDLPLIRGLAQGLKLLDLPVIQTLFLSPLAFFRNPNHRLVKDCKSVRDFLRDPIEDVCLALAVFKGQRAVFGHLAHPGPNVDVKAPVDYCP